MRGRRSRRRGVGTSVCAASAEPPTSGPSRGLKMGLDGAGAGTASGAGSAGSEGRTSMAKVLWTVALAAFVAWGATVKPGRPFSWTMYSGSSKAFLWIGEGKGRHVARYEELRLAPDNHYLSVADLQALVSGRSDLDSLQGFVIGSHGRWF